MAGPVDYDGCSGGDEKRNQRRLESIPNRSQNCLAMLKPNVFTVCEKVILDSNGVASLISLFDEVDAEILSGSGPIPPEAVVPKEWAIFTSWQQEPEDADKEYTQVFEIRYPDNSIFKEHKISFITQRGKTRHQVTVNVPGFPIGQQGTYQIRIRLEKDGATIYESATISIRVQHRSAPKT